MFISKDKRAFWLFLLWVLILPLIHHPGMAQDDDMFLVEDSADPPAGEVASPTAEGETGEPLPDEGGPVDDTENAVFDAAGEGVDGGEGGAVVDADAGGEGEDLHPELPALSADPQELLAKVNGPASAGKHQDVIAALQEHEDAVSELPELLVIYIEALLNSDKADWNSINRLGRQLGGKDPENGLAYYAQGMYQQNARKPDLGKALTFLGKAKSAKKPYAAASAAYYMVLAKKYGLIILALVALPIVVVVKKIKARKAAAALNLDELPDQKGAAKEGEAAPEKADKKTEGEAEKPAGDKKAEPKKKIKAKAKPAVEKAGDAETHEKTPAAEEKAAEDAENEKNPEKARPVSQPPAPAVSAPPAQPQTAQEAPAITAPPSAASYQTITAKHQAEIEQLRELIRPGRRSPVQADPELDSLWSELSRKAIQGKIAPQFRREEPMPGNYRANARPAATASSSSYPEPMAPDIDYNVSMDLSEESLKDDLTVKLKMMAITDSELRDMFAQKNPKHIPHLIEYVLTKPEPVRLAFVARELGNYDDPAVIDVLAGLLYNEDQRVALAAIQGLEQTKKVAAIQYLCPFLRSEIPLLAQASRTALNNFGPVKIMQAFHNLPQNSDERIRSAGVFVLSRMKGAQVEELLKQLLNDDSLDVRCDAILAMSFQKNPVYLDALREFFRIAADRDKALARKAIVYLQGFVTRRK
ncbi:MAG: hypothetical protein CVV42_04710 [Candidatus Riflebacteria bacterium HGW-Riflebacteria-2]|jgi:DNA polymerase III psi subunit|nr:MAG: hypothetical protein CVV42_04710 [Candidatus Riflebacteria bacterium HGW-Riflebacteria-2]